MKAMVEGDSTTVPPVTVVSWVGRYGAAQHSSRCLEMSPISRKENRSFGWNSTCPRTSARLRSLTSRPEITSCRKPLRFTYTESRRTAIVSEIGPVALTIPRMNPKLPASTWAENSGSKRGLAVMIEMRPADVLRPNRVPCGPRRPSIRSSAPRSVRPMPVRER